jgi:Amt family ammonium transporter
MHARTHINMLLLLLQFNAGSALGAGPMACHVFMTTNAAAGSAMLGWLLMDQLRGHKIRATGACIGAVIGLVAITPAAGKPLHEVVAFA